MDDSLNKAPCGFISFNDDSTIVAINATFLELLEYELDELLGKKLDLILPIASRIFYQTHFFPLLKMDGKVSEVYFSVRTKKGINLPMLINGVRREKKGEFVNECIFVIINQRIEYEEELLKAKKKVESAISAQNRAEKVLRQQYGQLLLIKQITQQIHESLNIDHIFKITTHEIRHSFDADRVGIFKFFRGSNSLFGEFVAESVDLNYKSMIGIKVYDRCLNEKYINFYQQGKIKVLEDTNEDKLQICYKHILEKFQIKANLVVPLVKAKQLWGLLCIHQCSSSRNWLDFEIDFIQQIVNQLEIALDKIDLLEKLQKELIERKYREAKLRDKNEELAQATNLLKQLVLTDGLTQIANRRYFDERLEQLWQQLSQEKLPLAMLLFDVDFFKRYNDTYGHQLGDECLIQIAQAAQKAVKRREDLIARYGGEEFAVILPNTDLKGAMTVAEQIQAAIRALKIPHKASEVSNIVTISIGISCLVPVSNLSPTILTNQSDKALYLAKQQGRNQSAIFCT